MSLMERPPQTKGKQCDQDCRSGDHESSKHWPSSAPPVRHCTATGARRFRRDSSGSWRVPAGGAADVGGSPPGLVRDPRYDHATDV